MGFMRSTNGQAINFSLKLENQYFNFKNGCTLNIERHMGDCMNKFTMSIVDGSDDTAKNIDMLFNNGAKDIELKYGYGSSLISMSGFIVDYKHTFVGDVYKLDMSGYVSLTTSKNVYSSGVNKYYIDWGPCIPKRIDEGMQWDAFYNAIQTPTFYINKLIESPDTDDESFKYYTSIKRFSEYYVQEGPVLNKSLEREKEYYKHLEEAIKAKNDAEAAVMESFGENALYNVGWFFSGGWWRGDPTAGEFNKQMEEYSQTFADYAKQWSDFISQYSSANNIQALRIDGPVGSCYIPYPDLFISFDGSCPMDLNAAKDMCDTWAFGLQTTTERNDKGIIEKFYINNDWAEMVKDKWKLRVLTIKDKKYIWTGDIPQNIDKITNKNDNIKPEENEYQTRNKKRWLTAAYNASAPIRDAGIRVSDIVKNLCDLEGWKYDDTTIIGTSYTNAADDSLRMNGEGAFEYIVEKLCPIACDEAGYRTNYKAWFDNKDRFHFEPLEITKPHDFIDLTYGYNIMDSPVLSFQITTSGLTIAAQRNDSISGISSSSGSGTQISSTARDFKSALVVAYEKDADSSLLFNEALYNTLGFNASKSSYDYYKNEVMVNGEIKGSSINIKSQNKHMSSVASKQQASTVLSNDMAAFEEKLIQAEMVIVGMPEVQPGRWIRVINRVKGGRRHYSSGGTQGYWIQSVIDTVSSDGFTQKLKLIRHAEDSFYFQENKSYDELIRGTGESYHLVSYEEAANRGSSGGSTSSGSSISGSVAVGATVIIKSSATTFTTGQTIAAFAKNRPSQVKSVSGDRALISYNGTTVGWVKISDLEVTNGVVSTGGSTSNWTATGGSIEQKTWNAIRGAGYSPIATAAAMGNIQAESGFNPNIIEAGGGGGFGLCQWTGGRRTQLENFAKSKGKSPGDIDVQLEFLLVEIANRVSSNSLSLTYEGKKWRMSTWRDSQNLSDATTAFMACFEVPNQSPSINHISRRRQYAQGFYAKYAT